MRPEVFWFLIVFAIVLKLIKYKFNFIKIKRNGFEIIKSLASVIGEYLGFLTGLGITTCFINYEVVCGISELNLIVIGLGVLMMGVSIVFYIDSITYPGKKSVKIFFLLMPRFFNSF